MALFNEGALLSALFGSNTAVPDATPAPQALPETPQAMPEAPPNDPSMDIVGFQQTHRNLLGRIADALSGTDIYEQRMRDRDMSHAMEGFSHDPRAAIARMAQIPGMAPKAIALMGTMDNAEDRQTRTQLIAEARKDKARSRVAAYLGAANPKNYGKVQELVNSYWQGQGYDPAELGLPDTYDPDAIAALRAGGMTVDQQVDNERMQTGQDTRLELSRDRAANTKAYQEARIGQTDRRLDIEEGKAGETVRHHQYQEQHPNQKGKKGEEAGQPNQVIFTPDGNYAKKYMNGKWWYFQKGQDGKHYLIKGQGTPGQ